jgi:Cu/Ag efflux protein CusF
MNNRIISSMAIVATLSLTACATSEVATPPPPVVTEVEKYDAPDRLERAAMVKATAVVTYVDQKKRLVTLKGSDGQEHTINAGPEVRNLAQVKKGDTVTVAYVESATFQLLKPGEALPKEAMAEGADRAKLGEKPAGAAGQTITVVAKVIKVDMKAPSITLKGSDGEVVTLPVRDTKRLEPVKVGDSLAITYSQAVAIVVETPRK